LKINYSETITKKESGNMSDPTKYNSLNAYIQEVTDKANDQLENRSRAIHIPVVIVAALISSGTAAATAAALAGAAYALTPPLGDGDAQARTMRLEIKSDHWGLLRLVVGTLETTCVIPPGLDLDGQFNVVLYNKNESRTSRIFAEYTGFPLDNEQEQDPTEKASGITVLYEFATKVDAYVQINHTKPLPTVLVSANRNNIDDWGNG
jgi:hypothetical protein